MQSLNFIEGLIETIAKNTEGDDLHEIDSLLCKKAIQRYLDNSGVVFQCCADTLATKVYKLLYAKCREIEWKDVGHIRLYWERYLNSLGIEWFDGGPEKGGYVLGLDYLVQMIHKRDKRLLDIIICDDPFKEVVDVYFAGNIGCISSCKFLILSQDLATRIVALNALP